VLGRWLPPYWYWSSVPPARFVSRFSPEQMRMREICYSTFATEERATVADESHVSYADSEDCEKPEDRR